MSDPFVGEIRAFAFDFPPKDWIVCDGRLLPIDQHNALFAVMGVNFGGDGRTTFGIPDLRGRAAMNYGSSPYTHTRELAEKGGYEKVALTNDTIPSHGHGLLAIDVDANMDSPAGNHLARGCTRSGKVTKPWACYADGNPNIPMSSESITETGMAQQHENRQPFLVMNFCLSLDGLFPSRS